MNKKSTQIALGGVFSALCLLLMLATGLIPFATYAMPALAGAMLLAVVAENGRKTALLVYISVSVLSALVVPDREAALLFVVFFGYYPVVREPLGRVRPRAAGFLIKLTIFNAAVAGGYLLAAYAFGMWELLSDMGGFGKYTTGVLLAGGNLFFIMYDYALSKYALLYEHWFKPTFLRR